MWVWILPNKTIYTNFELLDFIGSHMSQQLTLFYHLSLTTYYPRQLRNTLWIFIGVCFGGGGESLLNNVIQKPCPAEAYACGA